MTDLEKAVLSVVVYFDMFEYPVTLTEIWRWIDVRCRMLDVKLCLEKLRDEGLVMRDEGFYFLGGRNNLVRLRMQRYNIAEKKYKRALWVGRILSCLPNIRMIAVTNKLGYSNARGGGDIDLFIVSGAGRIWSSRFFVDGFLKVFGLRPKPGSIEDKICTPFFIDEENLDLRTVRNEDDVHYRYWLEQMAVIYDSDDLYERFRRANEWNRQYLPNDYGVEVVGRRKHKNTKTQKQIKLIIEKLFLGIDERFYRWLQMRIMPKKIKELALKGGTEVVINDGMLKLHMNGRGGYYNQLFRRRLEQVAGSNLL